MIDVVSIIRNQVVIWNTERKCDFCWQFTAPLRESDLNEYVYRYQDECCVLVAITDYRFACQTGFDRLKGYNTLRNITHNFNLHFLVPSDVGLNVYNEQIADVQESKWETILDPLRRCVACDPIDFCTELGHELEVTSWSATPKLDYLDTNYDGWTISVALRENNLIP